MTVSLDGARRDDSPCLADDTVAAFVDGALQADARLRVVRHLAACPACVATVAGVARSILQPEVRAAAARVDGRSGIDRRWMVTSAAAAAAILLFLLAPYRESVDSPAGHRSPTLTTGSEPAPNAPLGVVRGARQLRWSPVDGADRYRVALFSADGTVLHEAEVVDSVAALPDSLPLQPGSRYFWRVEARVAFDRWVSSDMVDFTVAGRSPR